MALPYKLLKNITIDGETMGLDPELGKMFSGAKYVALSANVAAIGGEVTVPETGLYLCRAQWRFTQTSTGNMLCFLNYGIKKAGQSSYSSTDGIALQLSSGESTLQCIRPIKLEEGDSVCVRGICSKACSSAFTAIEATKLIDIVGG